MSTINWAGVWSEANTYNAGDAVSYLGSSYVAVAGSTNVIPTNSPATWDLLAAAGQVGPEGPAGLNGISGTGIPQGLYWRDTYSTLTSYNAYDCVAYNKSSYICTTNGTLNLEPDTNPAHWGILCDGTAAVASAAFDSIESGTNTTSAMTVGSGASIQPTGTGVINATQIGGIPITGTLTHAGQIPISQPGNESAVWADPYVQGIQGEGTTASTVNPVLIGGKDGSGNLKDLALDASGYASVNVVGTVPTVTVPAISGGLSWFSAQVAALKTSVKASAGQIYGYQFLNTTAAIAYVQVFNAASASVIVGTTVPDIVIPLPGNGSTGAGATLVIANGLAFSTAITIACTTTRGGSAGAAVDCVIYFK